jgi:hypothetical protein
MTATATATTTTVNPADVTSLDFDFEGLEWSLRRVQKMKDGKPVDGQFYHGFHKPGTKYTGFGEQIPALSPDLPTSVDVDGVTIPLTAGFTSSEKKTKQKDGSFVVTKVTPRPKASHDAAVALPTFGHEKKQVKVIVSLTQAGTWNVIAQVTKVPSPASPEERAERAAKKASTNLEAIMAALGRS